MQPISSYAISQPYLRLLLQGPPGCGKTTLGCQFPGTYVADLDINLGGPLRRMTQLGLSLPLGYDIIDRDEKGQDVPAQARFTRLMLCLNKALADPTVQTIVIDSATRLCDYFMDEVLRTQNAKAMTISHWGFYLSAWKQFIVQMSAQRKHFVLIAHEEVEKDEVDQTLRSFIAVPGKFRYIIASYFTDVWRCEVASAGGFGAGAQYKWSVRTMPDHRFQLKNSLGLPPVFEFDWKLVEQKLKG